MGLRVEGDLVRAEGHASPVDCSHLLKSEVGVAFEVSVIQSTKAPRSR